MVGPLLKGFSRRGREGIAGDHYDGAARGFTRRPFNFNSATA
jgi:hypothetical protein